jgi:hypothetical protein
VGTVFFPFFFQGWFWFRVGVILLKKIVVVVLLLKKVINTLKKPSYKQQS